MAGGDRAAAGASFGQRLGEGAVESLSLTRQEVVVGGFLEERVAELVVAVDPVATGARHQDLAADGIPETVDELRSARPATCASRS